MARPNRKVRTGRSPRRPGTAAGGPSALRIVGGRFRGRKLHFSGDPRVRPMKDRVREAVFNLLGPAVRGKHAIDLFAGTGALALEAISRGAARATLFEQHLPTAAVIRRNIESLGVQPDCRLITGDVFIWHHGRDDLGPSPWLVFASPPYDFYVARRNDMLDLLSRLLQSAPADSLFVVESDDRFDFALMPDPQSWQVRSYPPAQVGIYRK